jgi:hypothetical protein
MESPRVTLNPQMAELTDFEKDREKQITRLAKSLKQKIEEAIQVEEVNKSLRDKLRSFQVPEL